MTTEHTQANAQSDVRHWTRDRFYFNPKDTALFVRKRVGVGHTLNLANPWAWLVIGAIALSIALYIAGQ